MFGYFMNDVFTFVVKPLKFWSQQHALDAPVLYTTSSTSLHNYSWQFAIMRQSRIVTGKKKQGSDMNLSSSGFGRTFKCVFRSL